MPWGDVDQLSGGAALDLLADAAGEAFERALRDMLVDARRFFRRRAENDDASRRCEVADYGLEELEQLLELADLSDSGGVEHESTEAAVVCLSRRVVGEQYAKWFCESTLAADEDRSGECGFSCFVSTQVLGPGQAGLRRDECAGGGREEL